jgi:hypothetical protein
MLMALVLVDSAVTVTFPRRTRITVVRKLIRLHRLKLFFALVDYAPKIRGKSRVVNKHSHANYTISPSIC